MRASESLHIDAMCSRYFLLRLDIEVNFSVINLLLFRLLFFRFIFLLDFVSLLLLL